MLRALSRLLFAAADAARSRLFYGKT